MNVELRDKNAFKQKFKKRCFTFSISILNLATKLRSKQINWVLLDQLIRAGTSIGANVVEGGNSTSRKKFINYFQIALKSSSETLYWLSLLKEMNQYDQEINALIQGLHRIKKNDIHYYLNTKDNSRL